MRSGGAFQVKMHCVGAFQVEIHSVGACYGIVFKYSDLSCKLYDTKRIKNAYG